MGLFDFLRLKPKLYSGGDGSSKERAVVINATSSITGISAEYQWLEKHYGKRDKDWTVEMQMLAGSDDGRSFDTVIIKLTEGTSKTVMFDVSSFYGRL